MGGGGMAPRCTNTVGCYETDLRLFFASFYLHNLLTRTPSCCFRCREGTFFFSFKLQAFLISCLCRVLLVTAFEESNPSNLKLELDCTRASLMLTFRRPLLPPSGITVNIHPSVFFHLSISGVPGVGWMCQEWIKLCAHYGTI